MSGNVQQSIVNDGYFVYWCPVWFVKSRVYKLTDGNGLFLEIAPNGKKDGSVTNLLKSGWPNPQPAVIIADGKGQPQETAQGKHLGGLSIDTGMGELA